MQRKPVDADHQVARLGSYVVARAGDEAGTTTIRDSRTGKAIVTHAPPTGFVAQTPVVLDGTWALIEEIRSEGKPEIRAYRYDLRTGRKQDLRQLTPLPPISEPEIGAYDGTFAYSTTDSKQRSCLIVTRLATPAPRVVACVAAPGYIADPVVSVDSVSFSEITAPETAKRCKKVFSAPLTGGPATPVPAAKPCIQWSGGTLRGATIWSEVAATDPDQFQSKAYLREQPGGKAQPLGPILTDTIVPCGSWIHWQVRKVGYGGVESYEIHRWRPGAKPQQIYKSPTGSAVTTPTCQDHHLVIETTDLNTAAKFADTLAAPTT